MTSVLWIAVCMFFSLNVTLISAFDSSKCKLDLGLVVDTTKSIKWKNVPYMRRALKQLVAGFDVSEDGTHVSLETFNKDSKLHNTFSVESFHSVKAMKGLIHESIGKLVNLTRLDKALFLADQEMFTEENGDRAGVMNVMVLFTDGKSHPNLTEDFMPAIDSLRQKGVRIVVVAIGRFAAEEQYREVLYKIAGKNIVYVDDYVNLTGATDDIRRMICPPSPCENSAGLDVAFLLDRTRSLGSLKNYRLLKGFLLEIVDALKVGANATRVGIVSFARTANVLNTFDDSNYHSNEALHHLIKNIPNKLGNRTFIDLALEAANEQLFTEEGGDRPTFPNVLILMTDGRTNKDSKDYSEIIPLLKEKEVHIVAIGFGKKIFPEELEKITENKENVYYVDSVNRLPDLFAKILVETCSVDGRFSRWNFWSECSKTCGEGVQTRTRSCTNPFPRGYGVNCDGDRKETRACNERGCVGLANGISLGQALIKKAKFFKRITAHGAE